jgi:hypothetical protein
MDVRPSRLRPGEWIAGGGALVLIVCVFALGWYGVPRAGTTSSSENGWHGLTHLRWLVLIAILLALALVWLQATRRTPALPVTCSMFAMLIGGLTVLALLYRVVLNPPAGLSVKAGAYVGLVATVAITYGGYKSMRTEGIAARDAPAEIETVGLGGSNRS